MEERTFKNYIETKLDLFSGDYDWRSLSNMELLYLMHAGHPSLREGIFLYRAMQGQSYLKQLVDDYDTFLTPDMHKKLLEDENSWFAVSQYSALSTYCRWKDEWDCACNNLTSLHCEKYSKLFEEPTTDSLFKAGFPYKTAKYANSWVGKLLRGESF